MRLCLRYLTFHILTELCVAYPVIETLAGRVTNSLLTFLEASYLTLTAQRSVAYSWDAVWVCMTVGIFSPVVDGPLKQH